MAKVFIHYDVSGHSISLETFVQSAVSAQKTAKVISDHYFSKNFELEIFVLAPEQGSFLQPLAIKLKQRLKLKNIRDAAAFLAAVAAFDATPMGTDIFVELTGKPLREWCVEAIQGGKFLVANGWDSAEEFAAELALKFEEALAQLVTDYLEGKEFVLEKLPEDLEYLIADARSALYEQLLKEKNIRAIGFSKKEEFPVGRAEFAVRGVRPPKPKEIPDERWVVSLIPLEITALAFKSDTAKSRQWRGTGLKRKPIEFTIEDQGFWKLVHSRKLQFAEGTILKVQMASRYEDDRLKERSSEFWNLMVIQSQRNSIMMH
ncbi:MAG: hypothetical protein HWE33_09680 [Rhodobacteraceae bacterium]|nr:hypothetical protein [Paracoccaceae bacterium]